MSGTEYRFDGLDALERRLAQLIERQYPAEFRELVIQIARELQTKVKEKTPVKTGRLQDSWIVGDIVKRGDCYYIEVYTNVEYAAMVEYGHRKQGGRGFVPGRHMLELSLIEVQARLTPFLRQWLHDFINSHEA
jgi:hypothetical protein